MIELKLYVSEVDFDAVIHLLGGNGLAGNAAALVAKALPDAAREELAVKYLNMNAEKLEKMLQDTAEQHGVRVTVSGASAAVVEERPGT